MKLSVVIATRDRAHFLAPALDSLAAQRGAPAFETIVVDNGSSDGTAALVDARAGSSAAPLRRVYVAQPNRAAARNAGIAAARGEIVVFVDDDVWLPAGFIAAHAAAHGKGPAAVVSGPILNVPDYGAQPKPSFFNYSGAFLCTCNVSVPRAPLVASGAFDERFNLYGWEDTELGLRLRRDGLRRAFAWKAFLYHIKPPALETFASVENKAIERARMAALLLERTPGARTRLATGAYAANLVRAKMLAPAWAGPLWRRASEARLPAPLRAFARAQALGVAYTQTLRSALGKRAFE